MKVLHVIDSGGFYGAEVMLVNLAKAQIDLGLSPVIASIGKKDVPIKEIETRSSSMGIQVHPFRMRSGPNFAGSYKIIRFANKHHFNVIHLHGYKPDIIFGLMPRFIRKMPLIATIHGWTAGNRLSRMKVYEMADALSLHFMDAVVAVNQDLMKKSSLRFIKKDKFHVIYNGINFSKNNTCHNKSVIDFCNRSFTVGAIGRLSHEKCFHRLIHAVAILKTNGLKANLLILGEGPERDKLERLILELNLYNNVYLPGYVEEANAYLPYFGVFAISSMTEGLPITLLEAMQAKIPIISTKVGGIPEIIDNAESGLLVNSCSPASFANAIKLIMIAGPTKIGKITAKAYGTYCEKMTANKMASRYYNVYRQVIKE